jgi:hypothetical protein
MAPVISGRSCRHLIRSDHCRLADDTSKDGLAMRRTPSAVGLCLSLALLGCGTDPGGGEPRPGGQGGTATGGRGGRGGSAGGSAAGSGGASAGSGGSTAGSGASGGVGGGGSSGSGGGGGAGGAGGSSGSGGAGGSGGSTGGGGGSPATDGGSMPDMPSRPPGTGPGPSPINPAQGPIAMGEIIYNQDFEENRIGISLSPVNLPPERAVVVDDPLGKYGKVMRVIWQAGDNYRTSGGTQPRSWISNAKEGGVQIQAGTKISLAWAQMFVQADLEAFFAQTIGPGPVWELRLRGSRVFNILCNQCGGNSEHMTLEANRWYNFRVDMDWMSGGTVRFYVDDQMIRQARLGGVSAPCHWDGGIYNTPGGTAGNRTRTVYIANLSVGKRP